jgi:TPR repeat protein
LEENEKNNVERAKANDPGALCQLGVMSIQRGDGNAFRYYSKAASLGDIEAHFYLSLMYHIGGSVERDMKKRVYHLEEAAIGGHPVARYNLGCTEGGNGRFDRAVKHFIIAAKLGFDDALEELKKYFLKGVASKEDYEAALRGHQAAVDAAKSTQREEAEKAR